MTVSTPSLLHLRWIPRACGTFVLVMGMIVICGWALHEPALVQVHPHWATMKLNTAISFLLAGTGILTHSYAPMSSQRLVRSCAALVIGLGVITLCEYLFDRSIIDNLIVVDRLTARTAPGVPGRMSPTTAASFVCVGVALLLIERRSGFWVFQLLGLLPGFFGLVALLGYLFHVEPLYGYGTFTRVAAHTAFSLVVLSLGLLFARVDQGVLAVMMADNVAGVMARRLVPAAIVVPILVGWLRELAAEHGLFTSAGGVAAGVVVSMLVFFAAALFSVRAISALDQQRAQLDDERRANEARYRALAESAREGIISADRRGQIVYWNPGAEVMFGYASSEALGQPLTFLMPESQRAAREDGFATYLATGVSPMIGKTVELVAMTKNGVEFPIEISVSSWRDRDDERFTAIIRDVTLRTRDAERIKTALREKEQLLREVHHRVKNNLQIISSLLNQQSHQIHDRQAIAAFQESRGRIRAMALFHDQLTQSDDLAHVDLGKYLKQMLNMLVHTHAAKPEDIRIQISADSILLNVDVAMPCGLIANELVMNAVKYAFGDQPGSIGITIRATASGGFTLQVADDGIGLPANFDLGQTGSLGLSLVNALVEQLGGTLTIARDTLRGARFEMTFPHQLGVNRAVAKSA